MLQYSQTACDVPARVVEYLPGSHFEHSPAAPSENLPAMQSVQDVCPAMEYFPAPQVRHVPSLGEYLPGGQRAHADVPVVSAYDPAAQIWQSSPSVEYISFSHFWHRYCR
jgi:hypothetical protein